MLNSFAILSFSNKCKFWSIASNISKPFKQFNQINFKRYTGFSTWLIDWKIQTKNGVKNHWIYKKKFPYEYYYLLSMFVWFADIHRWYSTRGQIVRSWNGLLRKCQKGTNLICKKRYAKQNKTKPYKFIPQSMSLKI